MALRLELISEHKSLPGGRAECYFSEKGGTIGRSAQSEWVLPDTDRFISSSHATIDWKAGSYYLADVSSNGVYVNHAEEPIGRGNPQRLFDGDHLRMGNFEMIVHLDEGEDLDLPPPRKPNVVPDNVDQLVPLDDFNSSVMLLDEEELTGDAIFSDAFFATHNAPLDGTPMPRPAPQLDDIAESAAAKQPAEVAGHNSDEPEEKTGKPKAESGNAPKKGTKPVAVPDAAASTDTDDLLDVFLRAAGLNRQDIHPSIEPAELMANAGAVLGEFVGGITELLEARSNVKAMFRLDQTTVLPRHNNPLKLSAKKADSIKQLLVGREGEYLAPLASVREACRDLRFHHEAVISGMVKAFGDFFDRFEPSELEDHFNEALDGKPRFGPMAKLKYWELYCDLYPIMTQTGAASLPQQFSEDFVRQYERQLADSKRVEHTLGDTQTLQGMEKTRKHTREPAAQPKPVRPVAQEAANDAPANPPQDNDLDLVIEDTQAGQAS